MNVELRRIVGPYGIVAGSGNYTLIREVMFNVGKENEYLKDMNSGFYGTFEQAIMGLRRQALRDGYLSEEESLTTLDAYIEEVKKIDNDIKEYIRNHKTEIYNMYKQVEEGIREKSESEIIDEEESTSL